MSTYPMQPLINNLNAAFAGLPNCGREPSGCVSDPEQTLDVESVAAGKILSTLEFCRDDQPHIRLDDECDFAIDGEYVWFDVPATKIRVRRRADSALMAQEFLEELSIFTHVAEAMKPTVFRCVGEPTP